VKVSKGFLSAPAATVIEDFSVNRSCFVKTIVTGIACGAGLKV